jgi:hypothetical protein
VKIGLAPGFQKHRNNFFDSPPASFSTGGPTIRADRTLRMIGNALILGCLHQMVFVAQALTFTVIATAIG